MNEIKELGGCDDSGISRMHAGAILSCTLVIRQPQLITRASNICTSADGGKGGETALYIQTYCNLSCFALMLDYVVGLMNFFYVVRNIAKTRKHPVVCQGKSSNVSVIMQIETCY